MEQKQIELDNIRDLQFSERDKAQDLKYFKMAHSYLQTRDKELFLPKLKSIRIPFQNKVDIGEKIGDYLHKPPDANQTFIPTPKMGAKINKRYDEWINQYQMKKERQAVQKELEL